jgi:hypothetical protein
MYEAMVMPYCSPLSVAAVRLHLFANRVRRWGRPLLFRPSEALDTVFPCAYAALICRCATASYGLQSR